MQAMQTPVETARRQLRLPLALTWAGMLAERLLRAFWPLLSLAAGVYTALAFGAAQLPGERALQAAAMLSLLAGLAALFWGGWRFHLPRRAEALARLDETLPGRPLAALYDRLALGNAAPETQALWRAHVSRMAARAALARPVPPRPALAGRDPFGLRLLALIAFGMALLFGAPARLADLARGLPATGPGTVLAASGPSWEGWAAPPRYTGRPALYLNALEADALILPEGTALSLRLYGAPGALRLEQTVGDPPPPTATADATPSEVQRIDLEATHSGALAILGPGGRSFTVSVLPDAPPVVAPLVAATRRADGKLSQPFRASDDYAVTRGQALVELDLAAVDRRFGLAPDPETRPPLIFDLPLPIAGSRAEFTEMLVEDAARHAFANLPVRLTLTVEDGRGQQGSSIPLKMELPGRRFFDPLAAALAEMRRDLVWSRANAPRVAQVLKAVSYKPEGFLTNQRVYLMLREAMSQLDAALAAGPLDPALRDDLAEALWQMALLIEDGGLADALAAMQRAQERLSEAMRNGASPDEIARLMDELKQATDTYIRMLAERGEQADPADRFARQQQSQQITGDQIQQMMDEIQRLMEQGRMAEAQELLDQLSRMLENLRVTQGEGGEGDLPGGQAMRDLAQTLRDQQDLSDQVFRDLQQTDPGASPAQPGQNQSQGKPGESPPQGSPGAGDSTGSGSLPERQRALRSELGRQQGLMPNDGSPESNSTRQRLDDAGRAMDEAERALREGDNATALDRQADAIEALREGMRALSEQAANTARRDQGQPQPGEPGSLAPRDPLGRQAGESGRIGSGQNLLQGEDVYRRARDLLDEIRRRSSERLRPVPELDYLRRLLGPF